MKSRWLKKAMAAFLAVLMTVCALPVAAFVPEMVETGEEFDGAENALPYYYVSDGNLYVQIENETQQIYPEYSFEYIYSGYEYVFAHGKNENGEIYDIVLGFMDSVDFDSKAENANLYTVTGSANEAAVYNYAVNTMGLNTAAACGILANIQKESGFNPHALGDSGTSYGICQWHNSRWDRLKAYCTSNNLDSTTIEGQLRYLEYELKNFYSSVWNRLKSVKNTAEGAYDAAAYWCAVFEVPAGYGYWSNGEIHYGETSIARGNLAKSTYWNEYSSAGDSGTNASLTATNAQQQVVDYALSKVGTSFANGYCQAFVSYTYANAGVGCGQVFYCCATKAWQTCGKGYSISDIPLGATVYFSDENAGSSRVYDDVCKQYCGHVGIYVGNGYVVHGWGGKVVKTTLNYITQCGYPYRGWGWHANFALADIKDVNFDTITTNTYRLVNNGSYLTTTADNNTTVLTVKAKSGTSNQQFYISPNSRFSQSYVIKSQAYSSGRVVNVFTTGVSANGDNVSLYTSTTDASQSWRFEAKSGGYLIHPVDNTGLALTNSNGTVEVMTSSGASNQIWTLASAVDTYTVSYNANGGTGAPGNQTKTHGQSLTLSSVKPTKDGYTFQGWSTSSTGSVQYNPGSAYTGNANLTLYAVWKSAHTHSYQRFPETMHPHRVYYICSCGASYYAVENGQYVTEKLSTCSSCYPVTGVSLNKTSETCEPETVFVLTATVTPSNAANKSVTWSSSNNSVATVSSGYVRTVGEGTAVITATTNDGSKTASCTVTVTTQKTKIYFNPTGGTGAPEPQFKIIGTAIKLSETVPTKPNCEFLGWSLYDKIDYQPGDNFTFDWGAEEAYLYAIWKHKDVGDIVWTPGSLNCNNWLPGNMESYGIQDSVFVGEVWNSSKVDPILCNNFDRFYAENYRYVVVEAEIRCDALDQNDCMAIYFSKGATYDIDETTSVKYIHGGTTGGSYKTFVFDMAQNPNWNGLITILRIDPFEENTGMFKIKSVKLTNKVNYTVSYNANGGTGAPASQTKVHGDALTLSTVKPTRSGYEFKGWATSSNGNVEYSAGAAYAENANVTLYAVWKANSVTSVTLNKTSASLKKGETLTLTATVAPSDAANKSVTWSSGNTSVATVSTSGVVTAVGEGTAVITVKTADGGKTASCTVAVAHTHNYTGTYYEAAHPHKAYSKCSCGEINYTGATQKVTSCTSCYPVTGVTLDKTTATLKKGETLTLSVTVSPSDAANKAFTVTSSNPSVMSAKYRIGICVGDLFDGSTCTASHCEFTALSAGSTTLTFTTEDGQKTASCKVTVTEPVVNAKAKFTLSEASGRPGDTVKITLSLKTEETVNSIAISGITYDKSIMTFTGFSDYEHIEDLTILPPTFDEEKMAIVIGLKNAAAFDGDICTLNFKINENALEGVTNIDASSVVKLKSAEIPSAVASGKVNVRLQTLGDIDGNDTVDIDDAVLLFQYSMLPELYPISYAGNLDFNKDGTVDIDDAVRLFQYSMLPDLYPLE